MIVAVHTIAGGVVGELTDNWFLAFVLGIILHFLFDAVPHYDSVDNHRWSWKQIAYTSLDFIVSFVLIFFVLNQPLNFSWVKTPFFWGAFGGFLPDLLDNVPFWSEAFRTSKLGSKIHYFHEIIHPRKQIFWLGMSLQVMLLAGFIWLHFMIK